MLTIVDGLLTGQEVDQFRRALASADWADGAASAGSRSAAVKRNLQLPERSAIAVELGERLLRKLGPHPLFVSAALPERIYPPKFNLYRDGGHYGAHVDAALMRAEGLTIRTDLSATLFLSDPDDYDGGELTIETDYGAQEVKLAAGDLVLYPSSSLHRVTPVTRGERLASFFWVQSAVPDGAGRALLFDLDQAIQALSADRTSDSAIDRLTHVYYNLLRRWARV